MSSVSAAVGAILAGGIPDDRPWFGHYPKDVPRHIEIPSVRLPELIAPAVARWGGNSAFVFYGARTSYREFWAASSRFASALEADGIRPGDRVALYLPNCPAYPIAFFGALRLGASIVQLSPLYHGQELAQLLRDATPSAIVTAEIFHKNLRALGPQVAPPLQYVARLREFYPALLRPFVNRVLRKRGYSTEFPSGPEIRPWRRALRTSGEFHEKKGGDPAHDVAVYQYTGGTTGIPKAAMMSHRNLVAIVRQCQAWFPGAHPGAEVVLASIPFFHVYGMTVALSYPLADGACVVMQIRPDVPEILRLVDRYRVTQFPGVPALYQAITLNPNARKYRLGSIRTCVSGSAPLPLEVAQTFEEITGGGNLVEGYGLSEAPVTHANPVNGERRLGSIGLPIPETDQRIVDLETGTQAVPPGEVGELMVRGPQVMLGYYNQAGETADALTDGWLHTGDIARIDTDGYAFIIDRKKDLIIVGGLKVYPREVEEVLYQHTAVAEAAVIGRRDERLGEVVHAIVVLRSGATARAEEIIGFVRDRMAHYKAPRAVEFRAQLPRSGVQKVLRRVLREDDSRPATSATPNH